MKKEIEKEQTFQNEEIDQDENEVREGLHSLCDLVRTEGIKLLTAFDFDI